MDFKITKYKGLKFHRDFIKLLQQNDEKKYKDI